MPVKLKILIIGYFTLAYGFAQKTIKPLGFTKDSLAINTNIKLHEAVSFEDLIITFEKVLVDSRCPKGVTCVRAGEAKILVSIFKDESFLEKKEVVFDAEGYVFENNNMFFKMKDYKIYATALHPYPNANETIRNESYNADFFVMRDYRQ
jgi:hypothetical protein